LRLFIVKAKYYPNVTREKLFGASLTTGDAAARTSSRSKCRQKTLMHVQSPAMFFAHNRQEEK
jgi:hypothetical protein